MQGRGMDDRFRKGQQGGSSELMTLELGETVIGRN